MARKFKLAGGSLDSSKMFVLLGVLAIFVVGYYLISTHNAENAPTQEAFTDGESGWGECTDPTPRENEIVVAAFIAKWCPHCVNYHPTWDKIKTQAQKEKPVVNGKKVRFVTVNCSESCQYAEQYDVEGFPTVKAIHSKTKHNDVPYEARDNLAQIVASLK